MLPDADKDAISSAEKEKPTLDAGSDADTGSDRTILLFVRLFTLGSLISAIRYTHWWFVSSVVLPPVPTPGWEADYARFYAILQRAMGLVVVLVLWALLVYARGQTNPKPVRLWRLFMTLFALTSLFALGSIFATPHGLWAVTYHWVGFLFFACLWLLLSLARKKAP